MRITTRIRNRRGRRARLRAFEQAAHKTVVRTRAMSDRWATADDDIRGDLWRDVLIAVQQLDTALTNHQTRA